MSEENNPRYLNLDELDTESDIKITHNGEDHVMATLTVEKFIEQQKRAAQLEEEAKKAEAEGKDVKDEDMGDVVTLLRNSVKDYFPTLPVDELPISKLFVIFAWLNEVSEKINDNAQSGEGDASGNASGEDD